MLMQLSIHAVNMTSKGVYRVNKVNPEAGSKRERCFPMAAREERQFQLKGA